MSMRNAHSETDNYGYTSHGEVLECDLCGQTRICNERDGMVACQSCQRDLLPTGWAF
jgi:hypothetical protein